MKKSAYSIILMDNVVKSIDSLAHSKGLNRSSMINNILAHYLGISTPEDTIDEIFLQTSIFFKNKPNYRLAISQTGSLLTITSRIQYPYNPTIKYNISLSSKTNLKGELRVSLRSTSDTLVSEFSDFFAFWSSIEESLLGISNFKNSSDSKSTRNLDFPNSSSISNQDIGSEIAEYILLIDKAINFYLNNKNTDEIYEFYKNYLSTSKFKI